MIWMQIKAGAIGDGLLFYFRFKLCENISNNIKKMPI